jgi:hypothetical protein
MRLCYGCRCRLESKGRGREFGWCLACAEKPRDCLTCGSSFVASNMRNTDYCGVPCKRRALKDLVRARRAGVIVERVSRAAVFSRDRLTCYLCHRQCVAEARPPEPHAATLDHVVPLCRGGAHTYANVRTACWGCNEAKGGRLASGTARSA